jgi:transcriptional regulator with XRE-family HTH domain
MDDRATMLLVVSNTFPSRLRLRREALGLDPFALAGRMRDRYKSGATDSAIRKYEAGKHRPSFEALAILAQALETSTDYLLGLTDDPAPATKQGRRAAKPAVAAKAPLLPKPQPRQARRKAG